MEPLPKELSELQTALQSLGNASTELQAAGQAIWDLQVQLKEARIRQNRAESHYEIARWAVNALIDPCQGHFGRFYPNRDDKREEPSDGTTQGTAT
jgi:hypothetical protein